MSKTACDHITTGCDECDPPGPKRSFFGDVDGDWWDAEMENAADPYTATFSEE